MNALGEKLASNRQAHAVRTPAAVCDGTGATGLRDVPRPDAPLVSTVPFSEMEGVLYSLARMV